MELLKRIAILALASVATFLVAQKEIVPLVRAQNTKMILVEKQDSEKLKVAYAEFVKAYDRWDAAKKNVAKEYVNWRQAAQGMGGGVVFCGLPHPRSR